MSTHCFCWLYFIHWTLFYSNLTSETIEHTELQLQRNHNLNTFIEFDMIRFVSICVYFIFKKWAVFKLLFSLRLSAPGDNLID